MAPGIPTVDDIYNSFSETMSKHKRESDYESIKICHDIAKANASSVSSALGEGAHGLLGLTLVLATYQAFTSYLFIKAPDSGHAPAIPLNSAVA